MFSALDKIEAFLIKGFLILAALSILFQLVSSRPVWADILILLNRLEGPVYHFGVY